MMADDGLCHDWCAFVQWKTLPCYSGECVSVLNNVRGGRLRIVKPENKLKVLDNVELCRIFRVNDLTDPFWKNYLTTTLENEIWSVCRSCVWLEKAWSGFMRP
jgi:hypothetical protein